jgi:RNA polymerase sigma-70 factor (ECF subfamily)
MFAPANPGVAPAATAVTASDRAVTVEPKGLSGTAAACAVAVPDNDLIARAGAGDRAAWAALVDRYLGAISGYAWYMLGDQGEAEDIAQETFIRLMGKAADWDADGTASLKTWLYRVAINLCIDRRRRVVPTPVDTLPETPTGGPAEVDGHYDRARWVARAVGRLPERQRAVLALVYYQGMSNGEAAEMLKLSVEAVESLLARARRALRATLEPLRDDLLKGS